MYESIFSVFIFFVVISIFTVVGFPIVFLLFKNFTDRGYPFSKLAALLITGYIVWLAGSLKIIYFSQINSWLFFLWFAMISGLLYLKYWEEIYKYIKKEWKLLLLEEIVFWGFFLFFLIVRYGNPDLWHPYKGGEKPMDFAFLNGILRSQTFPPIDPWFSQGTINYYYYGQYLVALLIKITGIIPSIFYNIALPYIFAQTAVGAFSIILNVTRSYFFGLFGSIFLVFMGNLAQVPVIIKALKSPIESSEWYWNATRVMPNSEINEFPFFTFLYADLHSHMIALPIDVFLIALVFSIFQSKNISTLAYFLKIVFISFILGNLYGTNIWDYPSFGLFSVFIIMVALILRMKFKLKFIAKILLTPVLIFALSNLFFLPFLINYQRGSLGLGFYSGPFTRVSDYLLIHGFFIFIFISFILFNFKTFFLLNKKRLVGIFITVILASVLGYLHFTFFAFDLALLALGFLALGSIRKDNSRRTEMFLIIVFIFAVLITLIPDLVDIKLGLGRMNTVFKFYFQAWILYAISSAGLLFFLFKKASKTHKGLYYSWIAVFVLFFIASLSFIPTATYAKIRDRMSMIAPMTLDGKEFMKTSFYFDQGKNLNLNSDYQATEWINANIKGSPVILEGTTPFYRWGSRVSIYTGLPTVIGWDWHEKAHRSYLAPDEIDRRVADVRTAYETQSLPAFYAIANKYNIQYIYLGDLEKAYYDNVGFDKFRLSAGSLFEIVYQNSDVIIYKIKNYL